MVSKEENKEDKGKKKTLTGIENALSAWSSVAILSVGWRLLSYLFVTSKMLPCHQF